MHRLAITRLICTHYYTATACSYNWGWRTASFVHCSSSAVTAHCTAAPRVHNPKQSDNNGYSRPQNSKMVPQRPPPGRKSTAESITRRRGAARPPQRAVLLPRVLGAAPRCLVIGSAVLLRRRGGHFCTIFEFCGLLLPSLGCAAVQCVQCSHVAVRRPQR